MTRAQAPWSLDHLAQLADRPQAQAVYAARLLVKARVVDLVLAALKVLGEQADVQYRAILLQKYDYYDANGVRRDPGGTVRRAILNALRPVAMPEDLPLLQRACTTYEFLYGEATGDLRAAGLLVLNQLAPELAGYHAVRLLDDQYTSIMSGEPAVTAVQVLAAQHQFLPLFAVVGGDKELVPDVTAESLRSLTTLPVALLPAIVEKFRESPHEIVLLGLFDLLLAHETRHDYLDLIFEFLQTTTRLNLYRYLLIALVCTRDPLIRTRLAARMEHEQNEDKQAIWCDVQATVG